jgi:hypothetical protein
MSCGMKPQVRAFPVPLSCPLSYVRDEEAGSSNLPTPDPGQSPVPSSEPGILRLVRQQSTAVRYESSCSPSLGSGLLLEGLEGRQAERVPGRVGVDTAVAVWLEVVLRGTGR